MKSHLRDQVLKPGAFKRCRCGSTGFDFKLCSPTWAYCAYRSSAVVPNTIISPWKLRAAAAALSAATSAASPPTL
jgi:hypothetical protein